MWRCRRREAAGEAGLAALLAADPIVQPAELVDHRRAPKSAASAMASSSGPRNRASVIATAAATSAQAKSSSPSGSICSRPKTRRSTLTNESKRPPLPVTSGTKSSSARGSGTTARCWQAGGSSRRSPSPRATEKERSRASPVTRCTRAIRAINSNRAWTARRPVRSAMTGRNTRPTSRSIRTMAAESAGATVSTATCLTQPTRYSRRYEVTDRRTRPGGERPAWRSERVQSVPSRPDARLDAATLGRMVRLRSAADDDRAGANRGVARLDAQGNAAQRVITAWHTGWAPHKRHRATTGSRRSSHGCWKTPTESSGMWLSARTAQATGVCGLEVQLPRPAGGTRGGGAVRFATHGASGRQRALAHREERPDQRRRSRWSTPRSSGCSSTATISPSRSRSDRHSQAGTWLINSDWMAANPWARPSQASQSPAVGGDEADRTAA